MVRIIHITAVVALVLAVAAGPSHGAEQEKGTPQDVFEMVLQGVYVIEQLGDEGLAAFNDPQGEFVFKDTYVYVVNCEKGIVAAHPMDQIRGLTADKIQCYKTGAHFMIDACKEVGADGTWFEYWWPKLNQAGEKSIHRKVGFAVPVKGTPYQVGSGVYNEDMSLQQLERESRTWKR
ncbi:MAG: cache domain-containing protein [Desulfatibacillaceae bacterium]